MQKFGTFYPWSEVTPWKSMKGSKESPLEKDHVHCNSGILVLCFMLEFLILTCQNAF